MTTDHLRIRPAAVAGSFYPADPVELVAQVRAGFADAVTPQRSAVPPKALVVPHAGLIYSGAIAASAYARLAPHAAIIDRIVLLGPSHCVAFRGIAATSADAFATPLGLVPVDTEAVASVLGLPGVFLDDRPHAQEHSLEVQLPFLQSVVPNAEVIPFVVGDAPAAEVAELIAALWDRPGTVVVVSTDLSHYHRYDDARELDLHTAAAIVAATPDRIGDHDACGCRPLRGLLHEVAHRHLTVEQIDLRNSGDTAGDHDRVVGYGAFAVA